mgnify:CR=1 FL=1
MLIELGMWTMKARVDERRLGWLKELLESGEDRVAKQVVMEQKKLEMEGCWYSEVRKGALEYGIDVEMVDRMSKKKWKNMVKMKIEKKMEEIGREKIRGMKKLKGMEGQKWGRQKYINGMEVRKVSEVMKTKMEMWDIGSWMGGKRKCLGCGGESEEMEHIWECEEVARIVEQKEKTKFIKEYILQREIVDRMK